MKPLVSVIVVTYNQEEFVSESLDSIITQDYPNFEICVTDDCSTDKTADIIANYVKKYPGKFKFITSKKNLGITKNWKKGLMAASGKYYALTAGDDLMLPGKLTSQVDFMEKDPECRISYHDSEIVQVASGKVLGHSKDISYSGVGSFEMVLSMGCFIGACTAMVRSEYIPDYGCDERLPIVSDWKFFLDILETGGKVKYIDQVLAKHLRHANNITSNKDPEIELARFQDLVTTCGLILCRHPNLTKLVNRRLSDVLREMRGIDAGKNYRKYLRASLSYRFNFKSFFGLVLGMIGIQI